MGQQLRKIAKRKRLNERKKRLKERAATAKVGDKAAKKKAVGRKSAKKADK